MKKHIILFAAISLVGAAAISCSKESAEPSKVKTMTPCTIQASTGEVSKTHISGIEGTTANVVWDDGDNISVFATNVSGAGNNQFTISNISGASANFSGEVEDGTTSLVAVYPYSSGLSYSGGVISGAAIPTTQSATASSFVSGASIALAKGTKTIGNPSVSDLTFSNLCAVIGFTLPENITFADQVVITAKSGANIAGNVSINATTPAITSADAASVTVNGTFAGGNTYYICIAPGTYTDGFNFAISTKGGNSYTRSTSKTLPAAAGGLYVLGKLSLALPDASFTPSVSVTHNVSGGTLSGSTAIFSMTSNVPDEFDGAIKSVLTNVTVWKGSKTYRSCGTSGKTVTGEEMTISSGCPYVPSGCSYTATIIYTINNGEKDVAHTITKNGTVTWSAPSGMVVKATPVGYTSYSCYTGADGQSKSTSNANNCDNSTIYGVGPVYVSGLSSDVKTQSDSEGLLTFTTAVTNQSAVSGKKSGETWNLTGQNWQAYTISITGWAFDTVSGSCSNSDKSKTVHVTGLPYNKSNSNVTNFKSDWSFSGGSSAWDDGFFKLREEAYANFKGFYIPASTNATLSYKMKGYCSTRFVSCTTNLWVAGSTIVSDKISGTGKWETYQSTANVTFTSSNNTIKMQSDCSSSSWAVSQSQGFYFGVVYR